jgi:protease-4
MNENNEAVNALKTVALEGIKEQRRTRRWGIFFKLAFLTYLLVFLSAMLGNIGDVSGSGSDAEEITAVVDVTGVIMDGAEAGAELVIASLQSAFEDKRTKGVMIRINSPGGSPVQAGYINDEIYRLKAKYPTIPVYAVVSDICASGGYYIAVAADKIYVDKASIVGSIGVRMDAFGFVGAMEKLGIERRLITAGAHKGILDPFKPINDAEIKHLETMLANTHSQFKAVVKKGRGKRLADNPDLFSGLFWTGEDAIALGLADKLGSDAYVAREVIQAEDQVNFTSEKDVLERLADRISTSVSTAISTVLVKSSVSSPHLY